MKNILLLTLCLLVSLTAFSQKVEIDAAGKVAIGKTLPPFYMLEVEDKEDTGRAINVIGKSTGVNIFTNGAGEQSSVYGLNAGATGATGASTGILGTVSNLTAGTLGYGVFGLNTNFSNLGTGFGVYGKSTGSLTNYGIYGEASGGTTNWAGYFLGNGYFSERLSIGTSSTDYPLMIKMNQSLFNTSLFHAEVEGTEQVDDIAMKGVSTPWDSYGIGGQFEGGKIGVEGISNSAGSMIYTGVFGKANGGSGTNYGLRGSAKDGITNLGVYGEATGGVNNWAGYFKGNSHFTKSLNIGTTNDDYPLHVKVHQDSLKTTNRHAAHFEVTDLYGLVSPIAVVGISKNDNQEGIGGAFYGGYVGAMGNVDVTNYTGNYSNSFRNSGLEGRSYGNYNTHNSGVTGRASGGRSNTGVEGFVGGSDYSIGVLGNVSTFYGGSFGVSHYGISGYASGAQNNYGGYFNANENGGEVNYGVYAEAHGSSENWAGYFVGNAHFSDSVGIGTTNPEVKLTVDGGSDASLSGGGYIMTNSFGSSNIVIDNNEIMARNNGAAAPLWINNDGGNVGVNLNSSSAAATTVHVKHGNLDNATIGLRLENEGNNKHWTLSTSSIAGNLRFHTSEKASDNGYIAALTSSSGTLVSISDARFKNNFEKLNTELGRINQLKGFRYNFIDDDFTAKKSIGFLAQDVKEIYPELVEYDPSQDIYLMNYSGFGVIAIKGIQELDEENQKLKAEIDKLKTENEAFEKRLEILESLLKK